MFHMAGAKKKKKKDVLLAVSIYTRLTNTWNTISFSSRLLYCM